MSELSPRASDADRERAVHVLREHLVEGRLTLDEFAERVEAALGAQTVGELVATAETLPAVRPPIGRRRPSRITAGLFAHVVRRGRLRLPKRAIVLSGFSDVDLDLRDAEITSGRMSITALLLFGNVDVYVPERLAVDVTGLTVFGHRREWGRHAVQPERAVAAGAGRSPLRHGRRLAGAERAQRPLRRDNPFAASRSARAVRLAGGAVTLLG